MINLLSLNLVINTILAAYDTLDETGKLLIL